MEMGCEKCQKRITGTFMQHHQPSSLKQYTNWKIYEDLIVKKFKDSYYNKFYFDSVMAKYDIPKKVIRYYLNRNKCDFNDKPEDSD